jgi:hypothetical protein
MKKLILKFLIRGRKISRYLKSRNIEAKTKSKEDLIVELLTSSMTTKEIIELKTLVDVRFKNKCLAIDREAFKTRKILTKYFNT